MGLMHWDQTLPLAVMFRDYGILPGSGKKTSIWSSETSVLIREIHETHEKKTAPAQNHRVRYRCQEKDWWSLLRASLPRDVFS